MADLKEVTDPALLQQLDQGQGQQPPPAQASAAGAGGVSPTPPADPDLINFGGKQYRSARGEWYSVTKGKGGEEWTQVTDEILQQQLGDLHQQQRSEVKDPNIISQLEHKGSQQRAQKALGPLASSFVRPIAEAATAIPSMVGDVLVGGAGMAMDQASNGGPALNPYDPVSLKDKPLHGVGPIELPSKNVQQVLDHYTTPPSTGFGSFAEFANSILAGGILNVPARAVGAFAAGLGGAANDTERLAALRQAHNQGYRIPPSEFPRNAVLKGAESVSGSARVVREMSHSNQEVTNRLAKLALGLHPEHPPLTEDVLEAIRHEEGQAYDAIRNMGQGAQSAARAATLSVADAAEGNRLVTIPTSQLDAGWRLAGNHVGPGGAGGITEGGVSRYGRSRAQYEQGSTTDAPSVVVDRTGRVHFVDGRHRTAAMRDLGDSHITVAMDSESVANARGAGIGVRDSSPIIRMDDQLTQDITHAGSQFSKLDRAFPGEPAIGPQGALEPDMSLIERSKGRWLQPQFTAGEAVDAIRYLRAQAKANLKTYDPTKNALGMVQQQIAAAFEMRLARHAEELGQPQLVQRMQDARVRIAQTYAVENALNIGSGNVSARRLGQQYAAGAPLTGQLQDIAKSALTFPRALQDADKIPREGPFSVVDFLVGAGGWLDRSNLWMTVLTRPVLRMAVNNRAAQAAAMRSASRQPTGVAQRIPGGLTGAYGASQEDDQDQQP